MESRDASDEKIVYESIKIIARILAESIARAFSELDQSRSWRDRQLDGAPATTGSGERQEPLTMTVPQAAKLLGVSRGLAYRLASTGKIPSIRLGHRYIVPRAALMKSLRDHETRVADAPGGP